MITSNSNPKVKYVRRLQAERRTREREGAFVIEGTRWLGELIPFREQVEFIFCTESWQAAPPNRALLEQLDAPAYPVSESVLAEASDTETPSGVLAVVRQQPRPLPTAPNLLLILDRLADPGNLGTIIRASAAAGIDGILLAPGSVDLYNPKVVRASMGALLRLPVHAASWDEIGSLVRGLNVWLAAAGGERAYTAVDWREPSALIIGSEARGAGAEASQLAGGEIAIPIQAQTESLNAAVAAAVILFEAIRQRSVIGNP